MIARVVNRIGVRIRRLRRWLSRTEWAIRLLRLGAADGAPGAPGLIMVQIDGLSHTQLGRALERGEMPFVARLLRRGTYGLHTLYSGLPSNTAAVQGELFYGVKTAVPAFSFLDRARGEVVRMVDPSAAASQERLLERQGEALLAGGSAYADIFTGGAAEPHFCPAALGWGAVLRGRKPWVSALFVLLNFYSVVRTGALLVVELVLAVLDCARGLSHAQDLIEELRFIPTRVAICILMRELTTIGAKIDVARGLPVVHLNLVGYDEQAHRRGPASAFAHWALKGIDDCIARIWREARRSRRRAYQLWVYSDHGQEACVAYARAQGRSVQDAVRDVFASSGTGCHPAPLAPEGGVESVRARLLGGDRFQALLPVREARPRGAHAPPSVTAMGPVGFVYCEGAPDRESRDRLAAALVARAGIPLVLCRDGADRARAWNPAGTFSLPGEAIAVLGANHPRLADVARDLVALAWHPDAGQFVICGWRIDAPSISFPNENGSHAGPGWDETGGFAVLPELARVAAPCGRSLRPLDLRAAALRVLGRAPPPGERRWTASSAAA